MFGSKPVGVSVDPAAGLAVVPSSVCKPEAGGGVEVVPGEPLEELLSFLADMSSFFTSLSDQAPPLVVLSRKHAQPRQRLSLSLPDTPAMAEITLATLTQEQLDRLVRQLDDSALEIATLTAERDSTHQQSTVNAPANAPAQSDEPIIISSGTPTQNNSVGQRSSVASEGAAHSMPGMDRNRAATSPREPREARRHVEFAATSGEYAATAPMPLKPQCPLSFDPSQHGGPTVQSWVFTMNAFFDANRHLEFILRDSPVHHVRCVVRRASGALRADCGFDFGVSKAAHLAAARRGGSGGGGTCPYVIRTGDRTGQSCGRFHTAQRCFFHLNDARREQFPDATELPRWADLLRKNIDIFALDFDAILGAMYALTISVEGDCYLSVPPDPGIGTSETAPPGASASAALGPGEAAALGTRASTALGPGEAAALGASESAPPGASASALAGTASTEALHTFTLDSGASRCFFRDRTTLEQLARPVAVSLADPSGGPVLATSCGAVRHPVGSLPPLVLYELGHHLATFTRQLGSDLYKLTTESPQVAASASASGQLSAPCSCRSLSHQTVLWHHRLGHPSVQRLRGMHSRYLVSGLPRVLPSLPPSPAPPCLPCVEGRQRAAPHSSSFPPTEAPLQTLHLDVWGPARVCGQGHERYFLLVVDDYTRYTTVFPLRTKGEVPDVLFPWIRAARLQLRDRFQSDFPVLRLHSDRGVRYAAHQLNLWPRVSTPETSPTLLWTGHVGDASRFRVWGARAFVRDTTANKLSARAVPCVFLGFVPDAPGWQFYHPTSRRVFPSQDVTFDESVPFYRLFPYRTALLPPPPLFLTPGAPPVDPLPPQGPAPSGVSQVDAVEPVEVAVDFGPERGTELGGTECWCNPTVCIRLVVRVRACVLRMVPGQQASAVDMAVEGAEDVEEEGLEAATSTEAAGVADTAMTTRTMDAVADGSTASVIFATRADTCGAIATKSLMDGLLLKAKRVEEQEEGEEEAVEAVAVAEVVLQV
ncbi:unnamed protein product [Closterium sp. NIES-54]